MIHHRTHRWVPVGLTSLVGATYDLDVFDLEFWRERLLEDRLGLKEEFLGAAGAGAGAGG